MLVPDIEAVPDLDPVDVAKNGYRASCILQGMKLNSATND